MNKTIYVLIGPQGSGKTYWTQNMLPIYDNREIIRISQDDHGKDGHKELFKDCLNRNVSMVIDRMNFSAEQRGRYTSRAYEQGYEIIFVLFDVEKRTCLKRLATRKSHPTVGEYSDHSGMLDFYFRNLEQLASNEYDKMFTIDNKGRCSMLDIHRCCRTKNVIVVGDIHGCFDEFMDLLFKCEYTFGDIVVATGDIVDRGPQIAETLKWFMETPGAYTVEGNHENKLRRHCDGNPVQITNGLEDSISQCEHMDKRSLSKWLGTLPKIIRLKNVCGRPLYVVHAGVDGRYSIDRQKRETCLYVRYLGGSGYFDSTDGVPWWTTLSGSYSIASGHIISEDAHPCEYAYCLDGGAHGGGTLRALVLGEDTCKIVEIQCSDKSAK